MDDQPSKSIKTSTVNGERPRSASPTSGDGVAEDETQEDEPSSSLPKASRSQELYNFRQQWKNELAKTSPNQEEQSLVSSMKDLPKPTEPSLMTNENYNDDTTDNIYKNAKSLYLNGVREERLGRLYEEMMALTTFSSMGFNIMYQSALAFPIMPSPLEHEYRYLVLTQKNHVSTSIAISFYRRAVQLVPDIEFHIANGIDYSERTSSVSDLSSEDSGPEYSRSASDDDEPTEILDLFSHIEKVVNKTGTFRFCRPAKHQNSTHLSELPHEIFTYILKWVVSSDLDCYSLEEMSKVCRGFYLSTRESGIWRLACLRVWGVNCGLPNKYGSWRSMFIYRPHLWFHGAYISKTSYVRYGESSFQDSNYRPVYIVDYFRYLRFFPDGVVLMLTTPDDPYQSLSKLRQKRTRHPTVLSGHFFLTTTSVVTIILKRPKAASLDYLGASSVLGYSKHKRQPLRPKMGQDLGEESFHIDLEIQAVKQRPNFKLVWKHYSLHRLFRNCQETVSEIDINPANFPPFLFSRVKSFNINSEFPLQ